MGVLEETLRTVRRILAPMLESYIGACKESDLRAVLEYCTSAKKAYDRALFVRLGCEAVDGDWRRVTHAMAAVELMDFSVITIDDLLDESPRRMGHPTVHMNWSPKTAIIAASILKSLATKALLDAAKKCNLDSRELARVVSLFEDTHRQIYIGQYLDIAYEKLAFGEVTERMYLSMVKETTGIQVAACCCIGAILGAGKNKQVDALYNYGLFTGMIFQIRDDFIDYIDDEHLIGKTPLQDFMRHKKRLPLMLSHRKYGKEIARILRKGKLSNKEKRDIRGYVSDPEIIAHTRNVMSDLGRQAVESLRPVRPHKRSLLLENITELGMDI